MHQVNLQPTLSGQSLHLRPLMSDDFESLFKVASDPLIWEVHPEPNRYQRDIFRKFFDLGLKSQGAFYISDIETGHCVGSSRFYELSLSEKMIKVGFTFLARKYWGGPFNQELKKLMLDHTFQFVDLVRFDVGSKNFRSRRALEKIGASLYEESFRPGPDGTLIPYVTFQIKKADWIKKADPSMSITFS